MGLSNVWLALRPMILAFLVNLAFFAVVLGKTVRREGWSGLSLSAARESGKTLGMRVALMFCKVVNIVAILATLIPTVPSR